ncbi:hypothetical protein D3C87_479510 [compost metagenome]
MKRNPVEPLRYAEFIETLRGPSVFIKVFQGSSIFIKAFEVLRGPSPSYSILYLKGRKGCTPNGFRPSRSNPLHLKKQAALRRLSLLHLHFWKPVCCGLLSGLKRPCCSVSDQTRFAPSASSMKLRSSDMPISPLFSGWNCMPYTFPRPTIAVTGCP